ncbi:hypothetical protein F8154_08685 [Alkaliphilus pronyensis]|uniref:YprB ribonuclease H-like domain-containing protein n=1 Tax=Alkaliphilus pronyensis TaxID=1482732 RepID=A0A6I0EYG6_9FIRM|nr:ribonuclease H-like domain-containing protein [Alkaliphilus pronyensis]KAB3534480.1 hypothetical protein F8154_08685 [Alkaliphilus pronyensis]
MIIKEHTLKEELILPNYIYEINDLNNVLILDIETTGLSKYNNKVILIGYLHYEAASVKLKQLFAEDPSEEGLILKELLKDIKRFDTLITYNGAAFDCPFLKERFKKHKINWSIDDYSHIDILQHIRPFKSRLNIPNLKLKTLEKYLGINRRDLITGADSVNLYNSFVSNKSHELLEKILLHNYEDIYYLGKVLEIFNYIPEDIRRKRKHSVMLSNNMIYFTYSSMDISINNKRIILSGESNKLADFPELSCFHEGFKLYWDSRAGAFNTEIQLLNTKLDSGNKIYYIDLRALGISHVQFVNIGVKPYEDCFLHVDTTSPNLLAIEVLIGEIINKAFKEAMC